MNNKTFQLIIYIFALLILICFTLGRGACTNVSTAITAVENMGFTESKVVDKNIFFVGFKGCSDKDAALYKIQAKNPAGKVVIVDVCLGWPFKGATVRIPN